MTEGREKRQEGVRRENMRRGRKAGYRAVPGPGQHDALNSISIFNFKGEQRE